LQAETEKTREVLPCSGFDGSRRGFRETVLLQPVHQKTSTAGRDVRQSDRLTDNAMAICAVSN